MLGIGLGVTRRGGASGSSLLNGLLAFWRLDEDSGSRADSSGNSNDLEEYDGQTIGSTVGVIGNAVAFTGEEDKYLLGSILINSVGSFSFAGWVKSPSLGGESITIVGQYSGVSGLFLQYLSIGGGSVDFATSPSDIASAGVATSDAAWYHFTGTYDGTTSRIYLNGSLLSSSARSMSVTDLTDFIVYDDQSSVSCNVDLLGVWNRALTAAEVAQLYNGGAGFDPTA